MQDIFFVKYLRMNLKMYLLIKIYCKYTAHLCMYAMYSAEVYIVNSRNLLWLLYS